MALVMTHFGFRFTAVISHLRRQLVCETYFKSDLLQLYDSNRVTSESAALIDKLQGSRVRGPQPFVLGRSRNNYLALQFRSDTSFSRKGFRGTISAGKKENLPFSSLQFLHIRL